MILIFSNKYLASCSQLAMSGQRLREDETVLENERLHNILKVNERGEGEDIIFYHGLHRANIHGLFKQDVSAHSLFG